MSERSLTVIVLCKSNQFILLHWESPTRQIIKNKLTDHYTDLNYIELNPILIKECDKGYTIMLLQIQSNEHKFIDLPCNEICI